MRSVHSLVRSTVCSAITLVIASSAFASSLDVPSGAYTLDKSHGYISFSYSHLGFSNPVLGFTDFDVATNLDSENVSNSEIKVTIQANSVSSRVKKFDDHLNSDDFFDTEKHPIITFNTTKIQSLGDDRYDIVGDLMIKGITKPVTLSSVVNKAGIHPRSNKPLIGVSATGKVSRTDFDLGKYAPNVGDEVTITIDVELPKADD